MRDILPIVYLAKQTEYKTNVVEFLLNHMDKYGCYSHLSNAEMISRLLISRCENTYRFKQKGFYEVFQELNPQRMGSYYGYYSFEYDKKYTNKFCINTALIIYCLDYIRCSSLPSLDITLQEFEKFDNQYKLDNGTK